MIRRFRVENSWAIPVILVTGCLVNVLCFTVWGVKVVNDSARYFEYRDLILTNGFFIDNHNIWYVGYVFFLLFCKAIGLGNLGTIVFQSTLSLIASVAIYQTAKNISRSSMAGLISSMLFLLWIKISQWNMYILCESLYISFTAITAHFFLIRERNWKTEIVSISLLFFSFFLKPTGISLLLAGLVFYLFRIFRQNKYRLAATLVLAAGVLWLSNTMLATFQLIETYSTGDIIYGCTWLSRQHCPEIYILNANGVIMPVATQPWAKVYFFFIQNPWFSIKLAMAKLGVFLVHIKTYYSAGHNLFIVSTLFPAYYFFLRGLRSIEESQFAFLVAYCLSCCLVIMLTVEDWDGRFLMPLLPLIFIFTGVGLNKQIERQ